MHQTTLTMSLFKRDDNRILFTIERAEFSTILLALALYVTSRLIYTGVLLETQFEMILLVFSITCFLVSGVDMIRQR